MSVATVLEFVHQRPEAPRIVELNEHSLLAPKLHILEPPVTHAFLNRLVFNTKLSWTEPEYLLLKRDCKHSQPDPGREKKRMHFWG